MTFNGSDDEEKRRRVRRSAVSSVTDAWEEEGRKAGSSSSSSSGVSGDLSDIVGGGEEEGERGDVARFPTEWAYRLAVTKLTAKLKASKERLRGEEKAARSAGERADQVCFLKKTSGIDRRHDENLYVGMTRTFTLVSVKNFVCMALKNITYEGGFSFSIYIYIFSRSIFQYLQIWHRKAVGAAVLSSLCN